LRVERVDNVNGLISLEEPWEALLSRCSSKEINLFLSYYWVSAWWTHFGEGKKIWLLLVKENEEIIGIAPLMLSREKYNGMPVRMLGFLVNKHTSRADFIIPERKHEVMYALVSYLADTSKCWDVLRLLHIPKESGNMALLETELQKNSKFRCFPVETSNILYSLPLTTTWKEYLSCQTLKFRKNIRYYRNQLIKTENFKFQKFSDVKDAPISMDLLFDLEKLSWKAEEKTARMTFEETLFYKDLAGKFALLRGLDNRFLLIDNKITGGLNNLIYHGTVYSLLTYYDDNFQNVSVGRNIYIDILQEYMNDNTLTKLDFNGESLFVRTWTKDCTSFEMISACNSNSYSRLISALKIIKRKACRK